MPPKGQKKVGQIEDVKAHGKTWLDVTVTTNSGKKIVYEIPSRPLITYDSAGQIVGKK